MPRDGTKTRTKILDAALKLSMARGLAATSLDDVIAGNPLEQGLAELVGYLSLDEPGLRVTFDDDARSRVAWAVGQGDRVHRADVSTVSEPAEGGPEGSDDGLDRVADIPVVTFSRGEGDQ